MTKYREYYEKMLAENEETFGRFRKAHDAYAKDGELQEEYNSVGKPVLEIIRDYEDRLCRQTEGGGYGAYSGNLAEKFWSEIRKDYPLVDRIGVKIRDFDIKKIKLV